MKEYDVYIKPAEFVFSIAKGVGSVLIQVD